MPLQPLAWTLRARPANPSTLPSRSLHYRPGPIWSPKLPFAHLRALGIRGSHTFELGLDFLRILLAAGLAVK